MSEELTKPLIVSIVGPLSNKIKCSLKYARKNRKLGELLGSTIDQLCEQVLPHFCAENIENFAAVNAVHNLVFLLALKA